MACRDFGLTVRPEWRPLVQLHVQLKESVSGMLCGDDRGNKIRLFHTLQVKSFYRNENLDESRTHLSTTARSSPFKYSLLNALPHFGADSLFRVRTAGCTRPASADWRTA